MLLDSLLNGAILLVILLHLVISPFTKVEESFNIQAAHDTIAFGIPLTPGDVTAHIQEHYDHIDFPGSVPRTFSGALLLAGLTQPFTRFLTSTEHAQLLVRGMLGLLVGYSLIFVRTGVTAAYGKTAGRFFVAFLTSQFHVMYYASRTLPNIFAFILTNIATGLLLQADSTSIRLRPRKRTAALYCLTIAGIVFRSELAILLLATTIVMLVRQKASFKQEIIPAGLLGCIIGLTTTIGVDSLLWCRWTWPELEGFFFNTILGKSSEWGTSPAYFYFLNAMPRLLLNPATYLICMPYAPGLKSTRGISRNTLVPHLAFIAIYSTLPHKEWRFVMYSVPAFTAVASGGAAWIWTRRSKSVKYLWLTRLILLSIAASYALSAGLLWLSSMNYPGGEALHRLHQIERSPKQRVHLDNLACQTGVTRFLQSQPTWTYDKTENKTLLNNAAFWQQFDYVIAEDPASVIGKWQVKDTIVGFAGVTLRPEEDEEPMLVRSNAVLAAVARAYNAYAHVIMKRLTKGRWPMLRFKTRLYILERERVGLKDDTKMTIQM